MARTRTLTQLLADVRYLADIEGQTARHPDTNITRELNQSIATYRRARPEWFAQFATGTLVAGQDTLPAPSSPVVALDTIDNILRLSVTLQDSSTVVLQPFQSLERYDYASPILLSGQPVAYRREGANIVLVPKPATATAYQLLYLPQSTDLALGTDVFDPVLGGGEQWVTYDAALRIAARDQSPRAQALAQLRDDTEKQLAQGSRQPEAVRVVDSRGRRWAAANWRRPLW